MATSGISTHQFDDAAIRGTVKAAFRAKVDTATAVWKMCGFEQDTTTKPWDEFTSFSGIGLAPRKEEFQQIAIDSPKQNYTQRINQLEYAIMIPVSGAAYRFLKRDASKIKMFVKPAEMAAESLHQTNETLASDVFGNAFSSTFPGMDGVALVSASHKLGRGGTSSNLIGTVALSQTALEAAYIQADKFPDDVGLPVGVKDGKRILVIPPDLRFDAERILKSTLQSDNANNAINTLKGLNIEICVNRYLPSSSNWFVVNTGEEQGLHAIFETKPEMKDFGDEKTDTMNFRAYQMCAFQFGLNWRRVQGSNV